MSNFLRASLLLLAGFVSPALAQGGRHPFFDRLPVELRAVKSLSNHDPGFGGRNDFYVLSKEFRRAGTVKEFRAMAHDRNPLVRAMGLLCLAQADTDGHYLTVLLHTKDEEEVNLREGCIISKITVGEFARRLLDNPYFLDPEGKQPAL